MVIPMVVVSVVPFVANHPSLRGLLVLLGCLCLTAAAKLTANLLFRPASWMRFFLAGIIGGVVLLIGVDSSMMIWGGEKLVESLGMISVAILALWLIGHYVAMREAQRSAHL